jgi:tRNA(His) 5'-end guanylyltransferase
LNRLGSAAKNELLFGEGINFNHVPLWQRRGVALHWENFEHTGVDPRDGTQIPTSRRRLRAENGLPMKDAYRAVLTAHLTAVLDVPQR